MIARILKFIMNHEPTWCGRCGVPMYVKDARWRKVGGAKLPLCEDCYKNLYNPREGD